MTENSLLVPTDDVREFNVVCVTKKHNGANSEYDSCEWHLPITGVARLVHPAREMFGIRFQAGASCVGFKTSDGKCYMGICQNARPGLSGRAVTLEFDPSPGDVGGRTERWELYTDTPTEGHTVEEVQAAVADMIAHQ